MQNLTHQSFRILRMKGLVAKTNRSKSALYDLQNQRSPRFDPTFPQPLRLGPRTVGWLEHEVDEWLLNRQRNVSVSATDERPLEVA